MDLIDNRIPSGPGIAPRAGSSVEDLPIRLAASCPPIARIHLLDHDSAPHSSMGELLGRAGFQVSSSSNAMDALDYLARSPVEILIASLEFPDASIPHLLHQLRILSPATQVILTSVRSDWSAYEEARLHGAVSLVTRPIHAMTLLRAVERALESREAPCRDWGTAG